MDWAYDSAVGSIDAVCEINRVWVLVRLPWEYCVSVFAEFVDHGLDSSENGWVWEDLQARSVT
jgi:hypothetical protein